MKIINHTTVLQYTFGGTAGSILGSISCSDLHHKVLQLKHINVEPQAHNFIPVQRSGVIKPAQKHLVSAQNHTADQEP